MRLTPRSSYAKTPSRCIARCVDIMTQTTLRDSAQQLTQTVRVRAKASTHRAPTHETCFCACCLACLCWAPFVYGFSRNSEVVNIFLLSASLRQVHLSAFRRYDLDCAGYDAGGVQEMSARYRNLFGHECAPPTDAGYGWRPKKGDIRNELRAMRAWMAKRDRDPWHGWRMSRVPAPSNTDKLIPANPPGFGAPSAELRAMQAGKAAYGQPARPQWRVFKFTKNV